MDSGFGVFSAGVRELGAADDCGPTPGGLAGPGVSGRHRRPDAFDVADCNHRISGHKTPADDVCDLFTGVLYGVISLGDVHCGKVYPGLLRLDRG